MENNKALEAYIKKIGRRLNMPKEYRQRVISDLSTSIAARIESGETAGDIMLDMGSPSKAARELNEQMKEYAYRKSPWRFVFIVLAALAIIALLSLIPRIFFLSMIQSHSIGIIGGADGPTSIIVSSSPRDLTGEIIFFTGLLIVSVFGFLKLRMLKKK